MIKIKYYDYVFIFLFLLISIFLAYKLHYGYFYNDEPFLLTLGYRFARGDLILVHDWNVASMTGYLIFPFIKIYKIFFSDNDGIIIFGRFCYLILWGSTVIFSYLRLRKYEIFNTLGCIFLYLFAPLDMMTLSYNSFCIIGLVVCSILFLTAKSSKTYIFAGLFFSFSVVSIPYMILIYFGFTLITAINLICKKIKINNNISLSSIWINFSIGAAINFFIFILFVFVRGANFRDILISVNNILKINYEHRLYGFIELCNQYIKEISCRFRYYIIFNIIVFILAFFDKKRHKKINCYLVLAILSFIAQFIYLIIIKDEYPNLNLTIIPLGIIGFSLIKINKDKEIFLYFQLLGIIYSFVFLQSSNLGLPALATAYILISFGTILSFNNLKFNNKPKILLIFLTVSQLCFQFYYRYHNYYLDENISKLTYKIENGPAKGIYTNINDYENYEYIYEQISWLLDDILSTDLLLVNDFMPWVYLIKDVEYGTYSTWGDLLNQANNLAINSDYYSYFPNKFPNYIIFNKRDLESLSLFINELSDRNYKTKESWDYVLYYLD